MGAESHNNKSLRKRGWVWSGLARSGRVGCGQALPGKGTEFHFFFVLKGFGYRYEDCISVDRFDGFDSASGRR